MEYFCWKCSTSLFFTERVPFRATCDKCMADLHVCKNCKYWAVDMPNECLVPNTEFVADRERANFCEEFKILGQKPSSGPSKEEISRRLFKDD